MRLTWSRTWRLGTMVIDGFGSQGFGPLVAGEERKVHDIEMTAGAESLRVMHEAAPRRSRNARLAIAGASVAIIVALGVLIAL
ncbi:MAG: hypothetical protein WCC60_23920 [Ilumatobacteraceae bacterium]